jgi:hypothetical protein
MSVLPRFAAVLEIGREANGTIQSQRIAQAYRASRSASVMLVLNRVSRSEVDDVLDKVVSSYRLDIPGVLYVDLDDDATVLSVASRAPMIFASSDEFCAKLDSLGIRYRDPAEIEHALPSLAS